MTSSRRQIRGENDKPTLHIYDDTYAIGYTVSSRTKISFRFLRLILTEKR